LRYKHEWDIEDICKKMRMSSNAVWFHIYKTMELLKKQI
jgi:DNA-directed RNA polymerase specialized sigma24 family protein